MAADRDEWNFKRIRDQVLKELMHLNAIGVDDRQRIASATCTVDLLDPHFEIGDDVLPEPRSDRIGWKGLPLVVTLRIVEQIVDQGAHPDDGVLHPIDIHLAVVAELGLVFALQTVAEGFDLAQRLLEVMGGDGGEGFQLAITARERRFAILEFGDVRMQHHDAAVAGAVLVDQNPAPVGKTPLAELWPDKR